jgi:hypothetical protein
VPPGDCNSDTLIDAGDLSALTLEVFDGDGNLAQNTPGGTFAGHPVGCDPNEDSVVDAGDLSCVVLIVFNGPGSCVEPQGAGAPEQAGPESSSGGPLLSMPDALPALPQGSVNVPVTYTGSGNNISALLFSVDYDQTLLTLDPTDANGDGRPDAVTCSVPGDFSCSVQFDPAKTDGELQFMIRDGSTPLAALPDGTLATLTLTAGSPPSSTNAAVNFGAALPASFGTPYGTSRPGTTDNGSVAIAVPTPTPPPNSGTGLTGEYYNNANLTALVLTRLDPTINFNWGSGSPNAAIGSNTFSARWTGQVEAVYSETYTFYTTSDDGVRLWVNNQPIINNWTNHGPTENSGTIALAAGQRYAIRLEYYENTGGAVITLSWSSHSQPKQIIPQGRLYPT